MPFVCGGTCGGRRINADCSDRGERAGPADAVPVAGILLYCVDHVPQLSELGAVGFRQPIDAMAEAAVLALQEQRKKGGKWRASVRRFAGELVES